MPKRVSPQVTPGGAHGAGTTVQIGRRGCGWSGGSPSSRRTAGTCPTSRFATGSGLTRRTVFAQGLRGRKPATARLHPSQVWLKTMLLAAIPCRSWRTSGL